ncbi:hypothetical protein [uncultured Subdoligranulum sp.]|uniref:hypothetical protein n=1 Tax=uncultured Subdoligranulum sp. TaxID=512298 RepID=UPI0026142918|nr:hypothetical protein [uncultured Subdoligranulum sp.]
MKKSSFVALLLGTVSGVFFALGMCMAMIPEWNSFRPGVVLGCAGLVLGLVTILVWRKMEHKQPVHVSGKALLTIAFGILGTLALGVGMCFCMVWDKMVLGIVLGLGGIVLLLCLIPLTKGIQE